MHRVLIGVLLLLSGQSLALIETYDFSSPALEAGASDEEILDYMVARYGEFVRYRPRFGGTTVYLWLAPILLLLAAIGVLMATLRSRTKSVGANGSALTEQEQARLQRMLDKTERDS